MSCAHRCPRASGARNVDSRVSECRENLCDAFAPTTGTWWRAWGRYLSAATSWASITRCARVYEQPKSSSSQSPRCPQCRTSSATSRSGCPGSDRLQITQYEIPLVRSPARHRAQIIFQGRQRARPVHDLDQRTPYRGGHVQPRDACPAQDQQSAAHDKDDEREMDDEHEVGE